MGINRSRYMRETGEVPMKHLEKPLRIAATGFVEAGAGSVASANAILLRELLRLGHEVVFFSKSSFVDPRPLFDPEDPLCARFSFVEASNSVSDRIRRHVEKFPVVGAVARQIDTNRYNQKLLRTISAAHRMASFDVLIWLGEYARGRIEGLPSVSFAQGPPGTDARSILRRWKEIRALTPPGNAWRWRILAALRLSRLGLPPFAASDRILVGSRQSARTLEQLYQVPAAQIDCMPYPIDLEHFRQQSPQASESPCGTLRVLWLGRIIPRKRLDLFLDGAALAIRRGLDLYVTVVGGSPMFPGYLRLLDEFPFPESLEYLASIERARVPALIARHHVLVQPSEEENFGSSVAEAQACGLPVVVGRSNGNADYLSERDVCLEDDRPETLAEALFRFANQPATVRAEGMSKSRQFAVEHFSPGAIALQLQSALLRAAAGHPTA
jgi:glycosyltransferase involved in cell wall biosynthesis